MIKRKKGCDTGVGWLNRNTGDDYSVDEIFGMICRFVVQNCNLDNYNN
jgi:hypothetical protein